MRVVVVHFLYLSPHPQINKFTYEVEYRYQALWNIGDRITERNINKLSLQW